MTIIKKHLTPEEYYAENFPKKTIVLHHTAGGANAQNVIGGWEKDGKPGAPLRVATAYVINGKVNNEDGVIYEAFDDKAWAHHLGTKLANNTLLNKQSIGIEICCWGQLTKTKEGKFLTYVNTEVPMEQVCELAVPFRGFKYFHEYSDKQIAAVKELILSLKTKYNINIKKTWSEKSFELSQDAMNGASGIFTHTNYRADKVDVYPSPKLIAMLNTLA